MTLEHKAGAVFGTGRDVAGSGPVGPGRRNESGADVADAAGGACSRAGGEAPAPRRVAGRSTAARGPVEGRAAGAKARLRAGRSLDRAWKSKKAGLRLTHPRDLRPRWRRISGPDGVGQAWCGRGRAGDPDRGLETGPARRSFALGRPISGPSWPSSRLLHSPKPPFWYAPPIREAVATKGFGRRRRMNGATRR